MSLVGTQVRGIITPIINPGDDLVKIVTDSLVASAKENGFGINEGDVVCVTEAVVAISQGNFATLDDIAKDVETKFGGRKHIGLVHPSPVSRNRFLNILKGISGGVDKLTVLVSPVDEVGNALISDYNPYEIDSRLYSMDEFVAKYGKPKHIFTGVDYLEVFRKACDNIEIFVSPNPSDILKFSKQVIAGTIHTRHKLKEHLIKKGAQKVVLLSDILSSPVDGSGCNPEYGLLGSNMAGDNKVKLFPHSGKEFAVSLQAEIFRQLGVTVHCMVYGDGAFKDPQGGIWELADPVVSPGYTDGLRGTAKPEVKLKNLVAKFDKLSKADREAKIRKLIDEQDKLKIDDDMRLGTTPRQLPDLLGSLADLVTGSGSRGTPVVLVQDYFSSKF